MEKKKNCRHFVCSAFCLSTFCPFDILSVRHFVCSTLCLSIFCLSTFFLFDILSIDILSFRQFVCRHFVCTIFCLSTICLSTFCLHTNVHKGWSNISNCFPAIKMECLLKCEIYSSKKLNIFFSNFIVISALKM